MATSAGRHDAHFYEDAIGLAQRVAQHLGDALADGGGALAIARAEHLAMFERVLNDRGVPLAEHRARGRYIPIDADVLCRQLVPGLLPDVGAFRTTVGGQLDEVAITVGDAPLHVYDELVDVLWAMGRVDAVIRLEQLWTEIGRDRHFDLLCGYRLGAFATADDTPAFETICAHHETRPIERTLATLAQRALALEFEIERRAQLEDQVQDLLERERRARIEADDAIRAREEIVSVVAHDLRNPLGTIMVSLSTLRRTESERVRGAVARIQDQAVRMARLLDDLVDLAGIQAGRLTLSRAPHAPADIVSAASELLGPVAEERGVAFESAAADDLPHVECDSERAVQVMANLIANAIKVTPSGGLIEVGATPAQQRVVFFVRDSGPGIDPGTGLGLSIARGIVDAHGGQIWAESQAGVGSTFYFCL